MITLSTGCVDSHLRRRQEWFVLFGFLGLGLLFFFSTLLLLWRAFHRRAIGWYLVLYLLTAGSVDSLVRGIDPVVTLISGFHRGAGSPWLNASLRHREGVVAIARRLLHEQETAC